MNTCTQLLIIGAGPLGLAAAARAIANGIEHVTVGKPMSFWKEHMPEGMNLRSDYDWHIDPQNEFTFERFVVEHGLEPSLPISLTRLLDYAHWFQRMRGIEVEETFVEDVSWEPHLAKFIAKLTGGDTVTASAVVCAPGFWYFRHVPQEIASMVASEHRLHSTEFSEPSRFRGRRALIIGGRQSAFETAALILENGAAAVTVVHRHATPSFEESDWSWVAADMAAAEATPDWFAQQVPEVRKSIERHFWEEGRLKLEPWLGRRLETLQVSTFQNSEVDCILRSPDGAYRATLRGESQALIEFDDLIFATGFKVDVARIPYLKNVLPDLDVIDGYPDLTHNFESSNMAGIYFLGLVAARQFGPYMGFLASCPFAARTAVDAVAKNIR